MHGWMNLNASTNRKSNVCVRQNSAMVSVQCKVFHSSVQVKKIHQIMSVYRYLLSTKAKASKQIPDNKIDIILWLYWFFLFDDFIYHSYSCIMYPLL